MLHWIWKRTPSAEGDLLHPIASPAALDTPELSDDDLGDVVGGLERIYVDGTESTALQSAS